MYSPKIKEEYVRRLYQLKLREGKPITTLANEAISAYLSKKALSDNELNNKEEQACRE